VEEGEKRAIRLNGEKKGPLKKTRKKVGSITKRALGRLQSLRGSNQVPRGGRSGMRTREKESSRIEKEVG